MKRDRSTLVEQQEKFLASSVIRGWISPAVAAEVVGVTVQTLRKWELAGVALTREPTWSHTRKYIRSEIEALAKARKQLNVERAAKRGGKSCKNTPT